MGFKNSNLELVVEQRDELLKSLELIRDIFNSRGSLGAQEMAVAAALAIASFKKRLPEDLVNQQPAGQDSHK